MSCFTAKDAEAVSVDELSSNEVYPFDHSRIGTWPWRSAGQGLSSDYSPRARDVIDCCSLPAPPLLLVLAGTSLKASPQILALVHARKLLNCSAAASRSAQLVLRPLPQTCRPTTERGVR